jgi:hypothetical protein
MGADTAIRPGLVPKPAQPLKLREARFEDHPQVVALESRFELVPKSYEEWTHLWTNNPAYRNIKDSFPIGWVLETSDGSVAGYLGNIPLHCEFQGRTLLAATTRAWVVDASYRSFALQLLGTYFKQRNVDIFLNTSVNAESAQAYSSVFQGVRVPVGAWDRSLFWIANYRGFSESLLRKKGGPMAKPLSYPLSMGVFLLDRLKPRRFQERGNPITVLPCSSFDERFDAFWAALRKKKSRRLLAVRNRETLEWHYKFALLQKTAWIYVVEGSSGLAAYAVFDRRDYHPVGLTRMRLTDFQCVEEDRAAALLKAMLQAALDCCRTEGFHMLELTGLSPRMEKELEPASPHRRQLSNWRYFYKVSGRRLAEQLKNADVWEPWLFDGDSSL